MFRYRVHYRLAPFKDYLRECFPNYELRESNGVYMYLNAALVVLYIGKAAANNPYDETYRKVGASTKTIACFSNHCWIDRDLPDDVKALIEGGEFRLGFVTVESASEATALEHFLQKLALERDARLPLLNARVG